MLAPRTRVLRPVRCVLWVLVLCVGLGCPATEDPLGDAETDGEGASFCEQSTPILADDGEPSGYEGCAAGPVHRAEAVECRIDPALPGGCPDSPQANSTCELDADCSEPEEKCRPSTTEALVSCSCEQVPGCENDDDCEQGQACFCDGWGSRCIPADCRNDDDCSDGSLCALYDEPQVCQSRFRRLTCVGADDACQSDDDCDDGSEVCRPQETGEWICEYRFPPPCG